MGESKETAGNALCAAVLYTIAFLYARDDELEEKGQRAVKCHVNSCRQCSRARHYLTGFAPRVLRRASLRNGANALVAYTHTIITSARLLN